MRRRLFLIVILLNGLTNQLFAQTAEGDWYTPIRNKLIRVTISADSIVIRKCNFESIKDHGYIAMSYSIKKKIGSTYIVSDAQDTLLRYQLFGFTTDSMHSDKLYMNAESINTNFATRSDAEKAIPEFEKQHFKIMLFTKQGIDNMRKGKDIETMTAADFNRYASKIIAADSANAAYLNKIYELSYLYGESSARILLAECGVNPLVKGNRFDDMIEKFYNNPETKDIVMRMVQPVKD